MLTPQQEAIILKHLEEYGTLAHAARAAGTKTTVVKRWVNIDNDFAAEFAEANEVFNDNIRHEMLKQAVENKNAALLIKLAESRIPEEFKTTAVDAGKKGKPTGLRLREFEVEDGKVKDAEPDAKPPEPDKSVARSQQPGEPPRLTVRWF